MDQLKIKGLLVEAARSDCPNALREEIERKLFFASPGGDDDLAGRDDLRAGMRTVLMRLWTKTSESRPDYLPKLFPFFALLCGDRSDGDHFARIDWYLLDE